MVEFVLPEDRHNAIVAAAYRARGYTAEEAHDAARFSAYTALHGIKTHNALKALHLDDLFGARAGGCVPGAVIEKLPQRYDAVERWNANRKLGQATAYAAMDACMALASKHGIGVVAVDNAFHYLWGGGYVIAAAERGYIAYTCCTAALAEVAPHGGRYPTLGTNPHSWAFPTTAAVGFPVCVDWATSVVAMGRVQQFAREGKTLPAGCGIDASGKDTCDPAKIVALRPFGQHKGYGLALVDELFGAYIGGSLPTLRSRWQQHSPGEKHTPSFYFQCLRPDAISGDDFAHGRSQEENVRAVLGDILSHGNDGALLPGQLEAQAAANSRRHGGLLFTAAEIDAFAAIAAEVGLSLDRKELKTVGTTGGEA